MSENEIEVDFDAVDSGEDTEPVKLIKDAYPEYGSKEWEEYLLGELNDSEKDANGFPRVHGLRRLSRIVGDIIFSGPIGFSAPSSDAGIPPRATVHYKVEVDWVLDRPEWIGLSNATSRGMNIRTFCAIADCDHHNTDATYAVHPSATASSRAESRCLRNLLGLSILSAEEMSNPNEPEAVIKSYQKTTNVDISDDGPINVTQTMMITNMCKKLNIDLIKFINMEFDSIKYHDLKELDYVTAASKMKQLQKYQNEEIPDGIKV